MTKDRLSRLWPYFVALIYVVTLAVYLLTGKVPNTFGVIAHVMILVPLVIMAFKRGRRE